MNLPDRIQDMVNEIQNVLGYGYSKEIYKNALSIALQDGNLTYEIDKTIPITFRNRFAGPLTSDILVDYRLVIVMCGDRTEMIDRCTMFKRISQIPYGMVILFTPQGPIIEIC
jgi:GxxExxY protein